MDYVTFLNNILINLIWPAFFIVIIWKNEIVCKIINSIAEPLILRVKSFKTDGVHIDFNVKEIEKKLKVDLDKLSSLYGDSKPIPYSTLREIEEIVKTVQLLEFFDFSINDIDNILILRCLGDYYHMVNDTNKALVYYNRVEKLMKKDSKEALDVLIVIGTLHQHLGNKNKSAEYSKKIMTYENDSPWAYLILGLSHKGVNFKESKSNLTKAVDIFQERIASKTLDYMTYYGLGIAYNFLDEHENAVKAATKAIDSKANFSPAYLNRAISKLKSEKYSEDEISYDIRQCIKLNPHFKEWIRNDPDFDSFNGNKCFKCLIL